MRVILLNRFGYPDQSATSQLLSDLGASLAEKGAQVVLVTSRQSYEQPGVRLPPRERWGEVDIVRVWSSRFGRGSLLGRGLDYASFLLLLPFVLFKALRRGDIVVAKTDPPLLSVFVAPVAWLRGARLVNWVQDVFPEVALVLQNPKIPSAAASTLRWLRNWSLRQAHMTVAIGGRMSAYLQSQGVAASKLAVIENWPLGAAADPVPAEESRLRHRLGLGERFVVAYSGNLGKAHDWESILTAARLLADDPRIVFLIVGGGAGYTLLREAATGSGLTNVQFEPYQPLVELPDALAAANVHLVSLLPALEGLIVPSKFYGIAAAGRAVCFMGDVEGEVGRMIRNEDCGLIVPYGSGDCLAAAVRELASDPELVRERGRFARKLIDESRSRVDALQRWQDLLEAVAGDDRKNLRE